MLQEQLYLETSGRTAAYHAVGLQVFPEPGIFSENSLYLSISLSLKLRARKSVCARSRCGTACSGPLYTGPRTVKCNLQKEAVHPVWGGRFWVSSLIGLGCGGKPHSLGRRLRDVSEERPTSQSLFLQEILQEP